MVFLVFHQHLPIILLLTFFTGKLVWSPDPAFFKINQNLFNQSPSDVENEMLNHMELQENELVRMTEVLILAILSMHLSELSPNHFVDHTSIALDNLHYLRGDVLLHIVRHRDAQITAQVELHCGFHGLQ